MKILSTAIFLGLCVFWASVVAGGGGFFSDERKPPPKDDPLWSVITKLTPEIKSNVSEKLANNPEALAAVKDSPIDIVSYKSQVVAGLNYLVKSEIAKNFFMLRIYSPISGDPVLSEVIGPVNKDYSY